MQSSPFLICVILVFLLFIVTVSTTSNGREYHEEAESRGYFSFFGRFLAGYIAGLMEVILLYPLDLIKTQQALLNKRLSATNLGILGMLRKTYNVHGILGFYKGVSMYLLYVPFWKTIKMGVYHTLRPDFGIIIASLITAMCECSFIQPFEKTRILIVESAGRNEENLIGGGNNRISHNNNERRISAIEIWKTHGFLKLYRIRDILILFCRQLVFNIFNFSTFEISSRIISQNIISVDDDTSSSSSSLIISLLTIFQKPICGFFGGSAGSIMNIPLDVILARSQQADGPQLSLLQFISKGGLFNGLLAKILRIGPGYAIVFTTYSIISRLTSN